MNRKARLGWITGQRSAAKYGLTASNGVRSKPLWAFTFCLLPHVFACAQAVTLTPSLTKVAGTGSDSVTFTLDYGPATAVALNQPNSVAFDSQGNQYFTDTASNCVRMIGSSGAVTTIAGLVVGGGRGDTCNAVANPTPTAGQGLLAPSGIAVASNGDLYIADSGHNCVRRLPDRFTGTASLVTVAGTCSGPATLSSTPAPSGLVLDKDSNLYIAIDDVPDGIYQVLKHSFQAPAAAVCVMAGAPSLLATTTCPAVTNNTVALNSPSGLAMDGEGDLWIADTNNLCIREIVGLTNIHTAVGQCVNDSSGSNIFTLHGPYGLAFDRTQALLITDGNQVLRYIQSAPTPTILAGLPSNTSGPYNMTQDGQGGQNVPLNAPQGLAIDANGNISVADSANHIMRQLKRNTIFLATPVNSNSSLQAITFDISQNVNLTAEVGTDYTITSNTCHGSLSYAGDGNPPTTCQVFVTFSPTRPGVRNAPLLLTDSISNAKVIIALQGIATGAQLQFFPGIVNTVVKGLVNPADVTVDIDGNAYVLERNSGGATADIKEFVAATGTVRTVVAAGGGLGNDPVALARDSAGNLYVADQASGTILLFGADGTVNTTYLTQLTLPKAVFVDGFDNLYVAQAGSAHNVIEVYRYGGQRTVAGSGALLDADGTAATAAQFVSPSGIFLDDEGVLLIADNGGHRVYAVDTSGVIHLVAGNGTATTTTPTSPLGIGLVGPTGVSADAAGDVFIADPPANIVYTVFATGSQLYKVASILGTGAPASTGDGGPSPAAPVDHPLSLSLDASGNTYVIDAGAGSVREISYPAPTLDFGTVTVGDRSPTLTAEIWNTGTDTLSQTDPITIDNLNFVEDTSSTVTTCGTSLVAGGTCELGFYFMPMQHGAQTGMSAIANNSYLNPASVTLIGNTSPPVPPTPTVLAETEVYGDAFPETVNLAIAGAAPTGTITFATGTQTLCTLTGTFKATTTCAAPNSGLSVGTYPVVFTYSGDLNNAPATANVTLTVTPQPTTTTLATSAMASTAGKPVTLTSTVTSALGAVAVGNVTFAEGNTSLGTAAVNASGVATVTTTSLAVGTDTITATYTGTLNFSPSTTSLSEAVSVPTGAFTITATPANQFIRGAGSVTWQVTVTPTGAFAGPVALTCAGLPEDAACSFAQGTLTLTAVAPASTTMTTTTTALDAALQLPQKATQLATHLATQLGWVFLLPCELSGLSVLRRRRYSRQSGRLWMMGLMSVGLLALSGCNCFNTSFKTYTITVTGTSTLGGPPPQSTTVQLSVGQQ